MNKITTVANILLLLFQIGISCLVIAQSEQVPMHWGIDGTVDSMGSPFSILILPTTSVLLWCTIAFFKRRPQYCNLPPSVKDRAKAFAIAKQMLDFISLWLFLMTSLLTLCVYTGELYEIGMAILWVLLAGIIFYFSRKIFRS